MFRGARKKMARQRMMVKATKPLFVLFFLLLAVFPFRASLMSGQVFGAGPDVVSTLWGMWWFQETGISGIFGGETSLVNAPYGAIGSVLSPSSAIVWAIFEPLVGAGRAAALSAIFQILGICFGVFLLSRQAGATPPGSPKNVHGPKSPSSPK